MANGRTLGGILAVLVALALAWPMQAFAASLTTPICAKMRPAAFESGPRLEQRPRTIVAIGSSSTAGIARNAPEKLYPAALEAKLRERWPQADLTVLNKGRGGEVMSETIRRFETDVLALKPSLVIWQLGVNDVLRYDGIAAQRDEIRAGLRMLGERGIPVILLDLQYAPLVTRDPDAGAMQEMIGSAAREGVRGRVFHFKRYAIMRQLEEKESVPVALMTEDDGLHMTDAMHECVGQLLADMISANPEVSASLPVARWPDNP